MNGPLHKQSLCVTFAQLALDSHCIHIQYRYHCKICYDKKKNFHYQKYWVKYSCLMEPSENTRLLSYCDNEVCITFDICQILL